MGTPGSNAGLCLRLVVVILDNCIGTCTNAGYVDIVVILDNCRRRSGWSGWSRNT